MALEGIRVDVRTDIKRAIAEFRAANDKISRVATVRALNRAAEALRTETGREVRKVYNVKLRAVREATRLRRASAQSLFASVLVEGARLPLVEFAARAVNPWNVKGRKRRPGGGVTVKIKVSGGRKLVRSAFLTSSTRNNATGGGSEGQLHVWRRTSSERSSLRTLRSISIPQAVSNDAIRTALSAVAGNEFQKNFEQQLRFLTGGTRG